MMHRLYVEERRTLGQVAAALGASDRRVRAAIVAAGIPLRPARRRADRRVTLPTLTAEQLTDLYVRQRLTAREIDARFGGTDNWVRIAAWPGPRHPAAHRRLPARPAARRRRRHPHRPLRHPPARRPSDSRPARSADLAGDRPAAPTRGHPPARAPAAPRPAAGTARRGAAALPAHACRSLAVRTTPARGTTKTTTSSSSPSVARIGNAALSSTSGELLTRSSI